MQQTSNTEKIVYRALAVCVLIVIGLLVGFFEFKQNWCLTVLCFFLFFLLFAFVFLHLIHSVSTTLVVVLLFSLIGYVIGGMDFVFVLLGIFAADIAAILFLKHRINKAAAQELIHQIQHPPQLRKAEKDALPKAAMPTKTETKRKPVSTCTHCGAAVTSVDAVICEYCGCILDEIE